MSLRLASARPKLELRGRAVKLEADPAKVWPRWMQIAGEGLYLGHPRGPFDFNDRVFDEIVRNLRALPEYKPGPDGVGTSRVIPYDWRHASEQSALEGGAAAIAAQVAQGWIWDVQKRLLPDGTLGLFALSEMLEPAKSLIDQEKIRWTSVCVWPDSVDRESGQKIGCYLSSVALTNDPFVRGMVPISTPIAAERYVDWYDVPKSAGELVESLRALFGLSVQAPLADVLRELTTLRACASGEMPAPAGVDVVKLVGALRRLFNLPTISSAADVFAACDMLLGAVAAEEALSEAAEPPSSRLPPMTAAVRRAARTSKDTQTMDQAALLAFLAPFASAFKCAATPEAVGAHAPIFFAKAEATAQKMGTLEKQCSAICEAMGLGPEDAAGVVDKIKGIHASGKALEAAFPDLKKMADDAVEAEDAEAKSDVAMAADRLTHLPVEIRRDALFAICAVRDGGVELAKPPELPKGTMTVEAITNYTGALSACFTALRARRTARDAFRKKMGTEAGGERRDEIPANRRSLFEHFAGERGGARGAGERTFERDAPRRDPNAIDVDLSEAGGLSGENPGQRALSFVRQHPEKFGLPKSASFDEMHRAAYELRTAWTQATQGGELAPENVF